MAENFILLEDANNSHRSNKTSTERNYSSTAVKSYVDQRKEKAEKQKQDEKNGISNAKLAERKWDEMQSYKYAIF
ncbi:hypothetical protein [Pedobacter xixiisoli]|uniref:Uncharacterized protein n=1 Tax=Pedobacter xixiisoli TaxID=1476464 RepID=A0A285ZXY8_9SPHI|nr:hypothetical protein [Pedobacter xixiisoli]SOD14511.1 hypothetical protein SAMN06297358_1611 [Pedobacter xixiisoli]